MDLLKDQFSLFAFSRYSPVGAEARSCSARVGSPGVSSLRGPPEAAAGTAGESAEGERGGSAENKAKASRGERERRAEGGGEWQHQIWVHLNYTTGVVSFLFFMVDPVSFSFSGCRDTVNSRGDSWEFSEKSWRGRPWVWKLLSSPLSITAWRYPTIHVVIIVSKHKSNVFLFQRNRFRESSFLAFEWRKMF